MTTAAPRSAHGFRPVLTDEVVREARRAVAGGEKIVDVAARYGVNVATLGSAVRGKTYSGITDPPPVRSRTPMRMRPAGNSTPAGRTTTIAAADADEVAAEDRAALLAFSGQMTAAGADLLDVAHDVGVAVDVLVTWADESLPSWGHAVLSALQVVQLRRRAADGERCATLADELGVSVGAVRSAVDGSNWGRLNVVAPPVAEGQHPQIGAENPAAKLTDDDVRDIRRAVAGGETIRSVASRYDVTEATAGDAARGVRRWSHITDVPPVSLRPQTRVERTPEDKAALIALAGAMMQDGCSRNDAAADLNVSAHTLYSWTSRRR